VSDRLIDRDTLDFLLYDWLQLGEVASRQSFDHDRISIDAVLDLAEELAHKELLPHFALSDRQEPFLDEEGQVRIPVEVATALSNICKTGIAAAGFPPEFGGMGLPSLACAAALGILQSALIATPSFFMLTAANARLIMSFGTPAQIETFARPQIAGRWFGTMCLSETQAGSSLADITTSAVFEAHDALGARYRLRGNKMWISGGDHQAGENILHLVLAKTPSEHIDLGEGTRAISLFMVPKFLSDGTRNDVEVAGLNHKLGYRGLPNCVLHFGSGRFMPGGNPGAVAWRVGEIGNGLPQMFQMMNEARINVGLGSAMVGYRAFQLARAYAAERRQGRILGEKGGPPVPIIQHPDVKRMLLAQKAYSEGGLALVLYAAKLMDEQRSAATPEARAEALHQLDLITPLVHRETPRLCRGGSRSLTNPGVHP
jgi:alkylation response protein AidB-like acyl-CoA dehydrogenase